MTTVIFTTVENPFAVCAACELESRRIIMPVTHRMQYTDSGGNVKDYLYCPRHANRIALDLRINAGYDVLIDGEPIALPIEFDVTEYVREHKSKWQTAHEQAKREYKSSGNVVRPQNKPTPKKTKAKTTPAAGEDFQWI